ncbi:hypothetical protein ABZX85_44195 [Streptomyces sp. NPDC004539]|uniref:hypothetical protein n=1 Tax=Streptomyces sp. NPDC004539 TaxID=3154280 RepID=UPI0033ADC42D
MNARERVLVERELVVRRYREGVALSRLAEEYGVTAGWLGRRFDEWGEVRRGLVAALLYRRAGARVFRGRAQRRTSEEVGEARAEFVGARESVEARYREGVSAAALAREFRVSATFVAERLVEWGVSRREQRERWEGPGVSPSGSDASPSGSGVSPSGSDASPSYGESVN